MRKIILTACTPNAVKKEPTTGAGGELTLEDGTKLIVPEHALNENSNIVI